MSFKDRLANRPKPPRRGVDYVSVTAMTVAVDLTACLISRRPFRPFDATIMADTSRAIGEFNDYLAERGLTIEPLNYRLHMSRFADLKWGRLPFYVRLWNFVRRVKP